MRGTTINASPVPPHFRAVNVRNGTIALQDTELRDELKQQGVQLIAVRHGQSVVNANAEELGAPILCGQAESPLTEKGWRQAEKAAQELYETLGGDVWLTVAAEDLELLPKIYTSPQSRACQTALATVGLLTSKAVALAAAGQLTSAQALGVQHELIPFQDHRLKEMSYGDFELAPLADAKKHHPEFIQSWDGYQGAGDNYLHQFPKGESRADVVSRVGDFLDDVASLDAGRTVILYSHLETTVAAMTNLGLMETEEGPCKVQASSIKNATPIRLL